MRVQHTLKSFTVGPPLQHRFGSTPREQHLRRQFFAKKIHRHTTLSIRSRQIAPDSPVRLQCQTTSSTTRRHVLLTPLLALGLCILQSSSSAASKAEDNTALQSPPPPSTPPSQPQVVVAEEISSRIYDATVIGEPLALGKDKRKVWEKLMNSRIVYLGEAEQVPIRDDKELELEIIKNLKNRCAESETNKSISLAMDAFPSDLQQQLNQYIDRR